MKVLNVIFLLFFVIILNTYGKEALRCSQCKDRITVGQYIKLANGTIFCSKRCYEKTLPKCSVCGKKCHGGYTLKGKRYCSKKCIATTYKKCQLCGQPSPSGMIFNKDPNLFYCPKCSKLPKCFSCSKPCKGYMLKDGRYICSNCNTTAVISRTEAKKLFNEVRSVMKHKLKLYTKHNVIFQIIDRSTLLKLSPHIGDIKELGLYSYKSSYTTVTETSKSLFGKDKVNSFIKDKKENFNIYVLYGLPKNKMIEVIGHELGHDWQQAHFPNIKDLKIKEGWAEYVATLINIQYHQKNMNKRMEENPDPIYGAGYRLFAKAAKTGGHKQVIKLLKHYNNTE